MNISKIISELKYRMARVRNELIDGAEKELVKAYDVGVQATIDELKIILEREL